MFKTFIKIIKILSILVVGLASVLILANLGEEELKPEVKQILKWQPPEHIFDKDNGYLIMLGIAAPENEDAWQVGKQRLQTVIASKKTYEQIQKEARAELSKSAKSPNTASKYTIYKCDYLTQPNCLEYYLKQDKVAMEADFAKFNLQLKRFADIKNCKYFIEATPLFNTTLNPPDWSQLINTSHINRTKGTLLIISGDFEHGVREWHDNALFSRRLLKESSNLISRMFAVRLLQEDMRILSELIVKYPRLAAYGERLFPVLKPISSAEYELSKVFQTERNLIAQLFYDNQDYNFGENFASQKLLSIADISLFYKPNETINLLYDTGTLRIDLAKTDANHLDAVNAEIEKKQQALFGFGTEFLYLRNPVGKILAAINNSPVYKDYVERQHDTDGFIRLVGLQLALAAEPDTSVERIREIMAKHLDPYTNKPMGFDQKTKTISFHGRQKSRVNFGESNIYSFKIN